MEVDENHLAKEIALMWLFAFECYPAAATGNNQRRQ